MKNTYFFTALMISTSLHAMTLHDAIKISLDNNPKTSAIKLRVESEEERLKALRLNTPAISVSAGTQASVEQYVYNGASDNFHTKGITAGISTSISLYDGGAKKFSEKEMEATLNATKARYNSSNAYIPNTAGSIAQQVQNAYASLLQLIEYRKYMQFVSGVLQIMIASPTLDADETVLVQQQLADLKTSLITLEFGYNKALRNFEYYTTVPAPVAELQTFEQAIKSLEIPKNAEEAFQVALEKNPNIKEARYQLEAGQYGQKASQARMYSPQVRLTGSIDKGGSITNAIGTRNTTASVGVSLYYTLDRKNRFLEQATAKNIEASQRDLDAMIDETQFDLNQIYPNLQNQLNISQSMEENLVITNTALQETLTKIKNGEKVDIKFVLSLMSAHRLYSNDILDFKYSILNTKFSIQRTVGTLFDQMETSKALLR